VSAEPFVHVFVPATRAGARTLLLLHGTGGDENDLLPLARMLDPAAAMLSVRGKVLENGMPRFFRRIAEGVFDLDDLRARTAELAAFLPEAAAEHGFDPAALLAVGYSNGANMAASLLLQSTAPLAGAVLLRAMVPYQPGPGASRAGARVLICQGRVDPIIPAEHGERVAELLRARGAEVMLHVEDAGHGLERGDIETARAWLSDAGAPGDARGSGRATS